MTMLKREKGRGTCKEIQRILEGKAGERTLGTKFVGILWNEEVDWGYFMDEMRERAYNDDLRSGGKLITYRHYTISPNPADEIDLDGLMDLTREWVNEFFGTDIEPGRLGLYQVAMVPHNDGKNHILHAHVIVNNTNLEDWTRLRIDNKTHSALWDRLQEMSKKRGLSAFESESEYRKAKNAAKTKNRESGKGE